MKLIFKYVGKHIGLFITAIVFLIIESVTEIFQPTYMSMIVDEGVTKADTAAIAHYGIIMLIIAGIDAGAAIVRSIFSARLGQMVAKDLRRDVYKKTQTLSLENIERISTASIITRITNDVTQVQDFVQGVTRIIFRAPIITISAIVMIVLRTPWLIPTMIVVIAISAFLIFLNLKIGYPKFAFLQKRTDRLNHVSREYLTSVRVVKAFNASETEHKRFNLSSAALRDAGISAMRTMAVFGPLINLTVNLSIVVLLWLAHSQDASQIGRVMASINYLTQIMMSLSMISMIFNRAVRAFASSERIGEILTEEPALKAADTPLRPDIKGSVVFDNVSFSYPGAEKETLSGISFSAMPGQTIGIIGPTGSGKSTLVNLIPRFYDADSGGVYIDDVNVTRIDEQFLRSAVSTAAQRAVLFTGTIRENLIWGDPDATPEEIDNALKISCADEIVGRVENGLDTLLGQGGVNLSGGQKQRVSLARSLLKSPRILILDDCTSALDATTEAKVLKSLRESCGDITVLLISQRISTVRKADRILCLDEGRVKGFDTHDALMQSCDCYRAIYASQIGN